MQYEQPIEKSACEDKKKELQDNGFDVLSCQTTEYDPGICILVYCPAQKGAVTAEDD
jgi:hypothetical protein